MKSLGSDVVDVRITDDKVNEVLSHAARIRVSRDPLYNRGGVERADYFPFGNVSFIQHLWEGIARIVALEGSDAPEAEIAETRYDATVDLINYAAFFGAYQSACKATKEAPATKDEDLGSK